MPVSSTCFTKETHNPYVDTSREQHAAGFERPAPGLLVPRDLGNRSSAGKERSPGASGLAAADLPRFAGTACRSAQYLPAPRHAPVVRTLRRHHSGMLLSRLAVRYGGSLPAYPGLGGRLIAAGRQNRSRDVSLPRTRRLRLGLPAGSLRQGFRAAGGPAVAPALGAVPPAAPFHRATLRDRRRDRGPDGSRARPFRSSERVVAQPRQHSREGQRVRTDSERVPDESPPALPEQRAVQVARRLRREI